MNKLKVHNKRINAWFVVDCGKVYDEQTNIQVPPSSRIALGAISYVKREMEALWDKMGEIDPYMGRFAAISPIRA